MRTMTMREMRAELGRLGEILETEGEVVITRRGKPIARVIPVREPGPRPRHDDLRASMPRLERSSAELLRSER